MENIAAEEKAGKRMGGKTRKKVNSRKKVKRDWHGKEVCQSGSAHTDTYIDTYRGALDYMGRGVGAIPTPPYSLGPG